MAYGSATPQDPIPTDEIEVREAPAEATEDSKAPVDATEDWKAPVEAIVQDDAPILLTLFDLGCLLFGEVTPVPKPRVSSKPVDPHGPKPCVNTDDILPFM